MKKICLALLLSLVPSISFARGVAEEPVREISTAFTVSVSTSDWTKTTGFGVATTRARRAGIKCSNPATNNAAVVGILSIGTPSEATTVRPIEIQTGENPFIPAGDSIDLYLLSLHTSAENVHCQEVGQDN